MSKVRRVALAAGLVLPWPPPSPSRRPPRPRAGRPSSQTDPNRGIGAARDWIYDQFTSYAAASGGRMTV